MNIIHCNNRVHCFSYHQQGMDMCVAEVRLRYFLFNNLKLKFGGNIGHMKLR